MIAFFVEKKYYLCPQDCSMNKLPQKYIENQWIKPWDMLKQRI